MKHKDSGPGGCRGIPQAPPGGGMVPPAATQVVWERPSAVKRW